MGPAVTLAKAGGATLVNISQCHSHVASVRGGVKAATDNLLSVTEMQKVAVQKLQQTQEQVDRYFCFLLFFFSYPPYSSHLFITLAAFSLNHTCVAASVCVCVCVCACVCVCVCVCVCESVMLMVNVSVSHAFETV